MLRNEKVFLTYRVSAIDLLRGIVMIIMALDHTRHYYSNIMFSPLDLDKASAALYLTRWISHFCAPVFIFLSGASAYLSLHRGKTVNDVSHKLILRGLCLIVIENTLLRWFGWTFSFSMQNIDLGILWVIGCSMVALAGLLHLPLAAILVVGLGIIGLHNFFDPLSASDFGRFGWLWVILHSAATIPLGTDHQLTVSFPLLPWPGIMAIGFCFGRLISQNDNGLRHRLLAIGIIMLTAFIGIRWLNWYGDPVPWQGTSNLFLTALSFINCTKHPASLCFVLMTLGPAVIALALASRAAVRPSAFLTTFARVPLFYYLLHIPLIHASFRIVKRLFIEHPIPLDFPGAPVSHSGFELPIVYGAWICVVAFMYYLCRGYTDFKRQWHVLARHCSNPALA
jgi:uncharacterized membrane protein